MTYLRCLAISVALVSLVGCATDSGSSGFKPVYLKRATVDYLTTHDPEAADAILGNNEYGERIGQFKAKK